MLIFCPSLFEMLVNYKTKGLVSLFILINSLNMLLLKVKDLK